jgi:hypothetical protein
MTDYRHDEVEKPERHPDAVKRLTEPPRHPIPSRGARAVLSVVCIYRTITRSIGPAHV